LRDFTSIDSPYEPPDAPELRIETTRVSAEEAAAQVLALLDLREDSRA
jgi:bifunctional enzyme CysN/CysC